jgi:hypothetical protein
VSALRISTPPLAGVETKVATAIAALGEPAVDAGALDHVSLLLTQVASELADLAAGAGTPTASTLIALRSDVSGHLLAAATLQAAGAPASASVAILRRAAAAARTGLDGLAGQGQELVGRTR